MVYDGSGTVSVSETATRLLARSLLYEALGIVVPVLCSTQKQRTWRAERPVVWTRETCCTALRLFRARHGRFPTRHEWRAASAHGLPAETSVRHLWGSVQALRVEVTRGKPSEWADA